MSADDSIPAPETSPGNHPWWADAVVYQVYPRSFADDDGDGIGDLPGLVTRLPYLSGLGVDAIWLSPCYPSPLSDGGYDVADYTDIDPRLGTLADFDALLDAARARGIRVIMDLVPNHCSSAHPLFQAALAAAPGSPERTMFIFRDGRGPGGAEPPNNWPSNFGGPAWTRVPDGQWYLHLFDYTQPDFNWRDPRVRAMFEKIIRFWLDRGVAGFRVDVAHGLLKDSDLADVPSTARTLAPSAYNHHPEVHEVYRSWRQLLDSYPAGSFPGPRAAVGEVWADTPRTLQPYLAADGLPQVFNFELVTAKWDQAAIRKAIDDTLALPGGSRAPWVLGNHDVLRPVTRWGAAAARAAALLLLALPGGAYVYQGEELGLPEVIDIPDAARQDPVFLRTHGKRRGRDGCRVPLPWEPGGASFGFSRTDGGAPVRQPWLPQPAGWGAYSVAVQDSEPGSFLALYREALRLRRAHPALGAPAAGAAPLRWLDGPPGLLAFARDPGFCCAVNLGDRPAALPPHREVLLGSGRLAADGRLPPGSAAWLSCAALPTLISKAGACHGTGSGTAQGRDAGRARGRAQPPARRGVRGRAGGGRRGPGAPHAAIGGRGPDQLPARGDGVPGPRRRLPGCHARHRPAGHRRAAQVTGVPQCVTCVGRHRRAGHLVRDDSAAIVCRPYHCCDLGGKAEVSAMRNTVRKVVRSDPDAC